MHLAKGLEFRAVAVMACDDEVIPLQERIETALTRQSSRTFTTQNDDSSTSPVPVLAIVFC
jgi:superfamily I DNA/RNA helicase